MASLVTTVDGNTTDNSNVNDDTINNNIINNLVNQQVMHDKNGKQVVWMTEVNPLTGVEK